MVSDSWWCLPSSATCHVTCKLSYGSRLKALSGVSSAPLFTCPVCMTVLLEGSGASLDELTAMIVLFLDFAPGVQEET